MDTAHFEKRMLDLFRPPLEARGFAQATNLKFAREKEGVQQGITFRGRFEYRTETFRFDLTVANRFLILERLLDSSEKDKIAMPLVATPIHLLREDKNLYEWYLDDPNTITRVMEQIDTYGIPFLDTYSDLSAVKQRLQSTSPADWFILTGKGRILLLAAIALFEGDKSEALRLVESALEERKNELPQKRWQLEWWQLEKLHKRLIGS